MSFNPSQPRAPKGRSTGGQWIAEGARGDVGQNRGGGFGRYNFRSEREATSYLRKHLQKMTGQKSSLFGTGLGSTEYAVKHPKKDKVLAWGTVARMEKY